MLDVVEVAEKGRPLLGDWVGEDSAEEAGERT
jgi:hypothetical protein